jgi:mutator protein MutT
LASFHPGSDKLSHVRAADNLKGAILKRLPLLQSESLMTEQKPILVVAGILQSGDRILICQRAGSDAYGLQWEFPGGKVWDGEALPSALRRELEEELAIQADVGEEVFRLRHRYPDRYVEVVFFVIAHFRGEIQNQVFEAITWAPRVMLPEYNFLEADRELVGRLARGEIV